ncbi:MAG: calcium-translocating P-type ATPase, SERCA-type [Candidatus Aenigmarchaeota archaeon]|nr:calcium-translocating P-type ATPase, SERCA-type [Candidatus Aenigmarchaeota archaeon]
MGTSSFENWHELEAKDTLKRLRSSENGLGEEEAESRLRKFGYNELRKEKGISRIEIFVSQFKSFLILILIAATIFSALVGEVIDAIAIIVIVILNAIFGFVQEYKAEKTIDALKKLTSPEAVVIRKGKERRIASKLLVPGDIVLLEGGSRVPADIRIIRESELKIDEAILTGESVPVSKDPGVMKNVPLAERKNLVFTGTLVTYGRGMGVVVETGMKTEIGKIAKVVQKAEEEPTPLQRKLDVFGKRLGVIILLICIAVVVIGVIRGGPLTGQPITQSLIIMMVITGIALAVAAIPEGLPAVLTITLALGLQRLAKHNALIRKLPAVEALGSTTIICADKTGTLTKNEMMISGIWFPDKSIEVTGEGYKPEGKFLLNKREIDSKTRQTLSMILRTGTLCTNATIETNEKHGIIGDPTEGAIVVAAKKIGLDKIELEKEHKRMKEIPFSSERKMMTTINRTEGGKSTACVKGAPEVILELCEKIMIEGKVKKMNKEWKQKILSENHEMTNRALRVLAIAYKEMERRDEKSAEKGLTFLGLVGMMDPPREEAIESVKLCKEAGIKVVMITGDHKNTAVAIAKEIGLMEEKSRVLRGPEMESMSDEEFEKIVEDIAVYARVNPLHKVRIVDTLKKRGEIIAMTGDGVNDAPALKKADIGIAMGIKGTDVAKEASDMILKDDNFTSIVRAVHEGRSIYDNIKKFIQYLLSSNMGEVLIVFIAILIGFQDPSTLSIIIPITAIQLLWINLLTDGLPALALGVDPPSPGIMSRPPRDPEEKILTRGMSIDITTVGIIMCVGTLLLFALNLPSGGTKAVTIAFTTIVMFEMVRVQSVRMKYKLGVFSNKKLITAIAISILLQIIIIYTPFFQPIFGTTPLALIEWGEIILVSSTVLIIMWIKNKIIKEKPWE